MRERLRSMDRLVVIGRLLAVATVVLVIVAWSHVGASAETYLSRPSDVVHSFGSWFSIGALRGDIASTIVASAIGFGIAMVVGVVLAALLASSKLLSDVAAPYVAMVNALPKIALAPLFLLLFGLGAAGKIYFVAIATAFIPFYAIYRALTTLNTTYQAHVKVLGASKLQLVRDLYAPAMATAFIATVRITEAFAILACVVMEFVGSNSGIGYEIAQAQSTGAAAVVISGIALIAIIATVIDILTRTALRGVFRDWGAAA